MAKKGDQGEFGQVHGNPISQGIRMLDANAAERKGEGYPQGGKYHGKYLEHQIMRQGPDQGILTSGMDTDE